MDELIAVRSWHMNALLPAFEQRLKLFSYVDEKRDTMNNPNPNYMKFVWK